MQEKLIDLYEKAQASLSHMDKEKFINSISLGEDRKLVDEVVYWPRDEEAEQQGQRMSALMECVWFPLSCYKRICIYPRAFELNLNYFLNSLFNHEMHHARQNAEHSIRILARNSSKFSEMKDYFSSQLEVSANLNQIVDVDRFVLTGTDLSKTRERVEYFEEVMKDRAKELGRDWKKDLSKILCKSPYDDVVRARFSLD